MKWFIVKDDHTDIELEGEVEDVNRVPNRVAVSLGIGDLRFCVEAGIGLFCKDRNGWRKLKSETGEIDIYRKERKTGNRPVEIVHYGIGFKNGTHMEISPKGELLNDGVFAS